MSGWADGPGYVTQCPIRPGTSYTYKFKITEQEGTLWWHAHVSWIRATVYGALIIRPRSGHSYPFAKPYREVPIVLGEYVLLKIEFCCIVIAVERTVIRIKNIASIQVSGGTPTSSTWRTSFSPLERPPTTPLPTLSTEGPATSTIALGTICIS